MNSKDRGDTWLGGKVNRHRNTIVDMCKREHIATDMLMEVSIALDEDFFSYLSEELKRRTGKSFGAPELNHFRPNKEQQILLTLVDGKLKKAEDITDTLKKGEEID
jgi:hypothetical protein